MSQGVFHDEQFLWQDGTPEILIDYQDTVKISPSQVSDEDNFLRNVGLYSKAKNTPKKILHHKIIEWKIMKLIASEAYL